MRYKICTYSRSMYICWILWVGSLTLSLR
jgi:hypothetical protein